MNLKHSKIFECFFHIKVAFDYLRTKTVEILHFVQDDKWGSQDDKWDMSLRAQRGNLNPVATSCVISER